MPDENEVDINKLDKAMRPGEGPGTEMAWCSPAEAPFHVAGFPWFARDGVYRRLPLEPARPLPEAVDRLANWTAGGQIRFQTDSVKLAVRVTLSDVADMNHMPATGQCGFDCYLGPAGRQRYVSTTKYDHHQTTYENLLFDLRPARMRNITLNFPLYMGVKEVEVGLDKDAQALAPEPYDMDGRVVVYGTSITQGGCASRPGMAYTNILSRRLNVAFVNLGFSGNGRGEKEVAATIAEIPDPLCFVLDYEANCVSTELLQETFPVFIQTLREAHANVPILAVSRIPFAGDLTNEDTLQTRLDRSAFQYKTVEHLRQRGDANIHFVDGSAFLGEDFDECTVDGVHPSDLGFIRIADAMTPVLRMILKRAEQQ